jgi:Protein of unknown function with HXXEE motif
MRFLRKHWFDLGGFFALLILLYLGFDYNNLSSYQVVMWISLASLFIHQLEEYRIVGSFPGMINKCMFRSDKPDRYPLNSQTALIINVCVGWIPYFLAAYFAEKAIWLGMATILISFGNTLAHCIIFNVKGKAFYNAGMASSLILFLPITIAFFYIITIEHLASVWDYFIGIPLGYALNFIGVLKLIYWIKN